MDKELKPGDWILTPYGFDETVFYVLAVHEDRIVLGNPKWLSSSYTLMRMSELARKGYIYLGSTKLRVWWRFVPPFLRELVHPYKRLKTMLGFAT